MFQKWSTFWNVFPTREHSSRFCNHDTLQTVSHFAVQRVSCLIMLSEATLVISKGRATNLGRSGVWNSVRFLPFFFSTWFPPMFTSYLLFLILYPSPCLFLLFLLDPFFISYLFLFLLYTLVIFKCASFPCSCTTSSSFFSVYPLVCFESLGVDRTLMQDDIKR